MRGTFCNRDARRGPARLQRIIARASASCAKLAASSERTCRTVKWPHPCSKPSIATDGSWRRARSTPGGSRAARPGRPSFRRHRARLPRRIHRLKRRHPPRPGHTRQPHATAEAAGATARGSPARADRHRRGRRHPRLQWTPLALGPQKRRPTLAPRGADARGPALIWARAGRVSTSRDISRRCTLRAAPSRAAGSRSCARRDRPSRRARQGGRGRSPASDGRGCAS